MSTGKTVEYERGYHKLFAIRTFKYFRYTRTGFLYDMIRNAGMTLDLDDYDDDDDDYSIVVLALSSFSIFYQPNYGSHEKRPVHYSPKKQIQLESRFFSKRLLQTAAPFSFLRP